jgi:AcrR family transcriptional regulator
VKEKEKVIIEAAIKLYAAKGFSSTSIQEIVTESGISKGAFYLYFKSKDALLIAILEYYFNHIENNVKAIEQENLPVREKFAKQLSVLYKTMVEHKEFIIMQSREQAIPLNEEVKELMFRKHYEAMIFYQASLKAIYGIKAEPHLWDLSLILEGLYNSYMRLLLFNSKGFQIEKVVEYILRRMDTVVEGLIGEEPITNQKKIEDLFREAKAFFIANPKDIKKVLAKMKQVIEDIPNNEDLNVSLDVLEAEISKDSPRLPVIQGMLFNFKDQEKLSLYRDEIAKYYQLKL